MNNEIDHEMEEEEEEELKIQDYLEYSLEEYHKILKRDGGVKVDLNNWLKANDINTREQSQVFLDHFNTHLARQGISKEKFPSYDNPDGFGWINNVAKRIKHMGDKKAAMSMFYTNENSKDNTINTRNPAASRNDGMGYATTEYDLKNQEKIQEMTRDLYAALYGVQPQKIRRHKERFGIKFEDSKDMADHFDMSPISATNFKVRQADDPRSYGPTQRVQGFITIEASGVDDGFYYYKNMHQLENFKKVVGFLQEEKRTVAEIKYSQMIDKKTNDEAILAYLKESLELITKENPPSIRRKISESKEAFERQKQLRKLENVILQLKKLPDSMKPLKKDQIEKFLREILLKLENEVQKNENEFKIVHRKYIKRLEPLEATSRITLASKALTKEAVEKWGCERVEVHLKPGEAFFWYCGCAHGNLAVPINNISKETGKSVFRAVQYINYAEITDLDTEETDCKDVIGLGNHKNTKAVVEQKNKKTSSTPLPPPSSIKMKKKTMIKRDNKSNNNNASDNSKPEKKKKKPSEKTSNKKRKIDSVE
jgi:ribosomal protein L11 methylase PrmA